MRFILGIIVGAALTVGAAYFADTMASGPSARPMVNWTVVSENVDELTKWARESWKRIVG